MPLVYPRVPELKDRWDQYLFGSDLLVAPIWEIGQRSREVYLPSGTWRNYWDSSQVYQGRQTLTVEAPLDIIPVFVRDGATVPSPNSLFDEDTTLTSETKLPQVSELSEESASLFFDGSYDSLRAEQLSPALEREIVFGSSEADLFIASPNGVFDGNKDLVLAGKGNDEIDSVSVTSTNLEAGQNLIYAGDGNDLIFVGRNDKVYGGNGHDEFDALDSQGGNHLFGESGSDRFFLGRDDFLVGGDGEDHFFVGEGGDNILTGSLGNDLFWIANGTIPEQLNVITDFTKDEDLIGLAGTASLGIASFENITQQVTEEGLRLSSSNDFLVLLQGVTAPLVITSALIITKHSERGTEK